MRTTLPIILGVLALGTVPFAWLPEKAKIASVAEEKTSIGTKISPDQVSSLRVATFDDTSKSAQILEINRANGVWTIPSHFDFPADGNTRVSKVAAGFLGVDRGRLVTDDAKEHEKLELLDPMDAANLTKKGHGKRLTMKDQGGATVIDLLVGKYVEGAQSLYYVREAGKNEVYTAKVDPWELSTRFTDYVQTDPFKVERDEVATLAVKDYSIDEQQGTLTPRSETTLSRANKDANWDSAQTPADKRVKKETADNILNELTGMKLEGVRPYQKAWMQPRGFYPGSDGNLYGNEGGLVVNTTKGLRYELYFGEVAADDTEDTTAERKAPGSDTAAAATPKGNKRYLLMVVRYDANADSDAQAVKAAGSDTVAASAAQKKADTNKATAERLQKRFLQFFYVISDESFKKLRPALDTLFEAKPAEPMAGTTGKTNQQWLDEKSKEDGIKATGSGLLYQVISSGPAEGVPPTDSQQVEVHYKGTLVDGSEFDASKGAPASFGVTGVIKGWTEALKLMKPGDKWRLFIPPALGYGEAGSPPKIPANSILIFEVELVSVK